AVGVGAMVAMVAAGQGAEHAAVEKIQSMGSNLVVLSAGQVKVVAGRARQVGNTTTLTLEDAQALAEECSAVARAAPLQSRKLPLKFEDLSASSSVSGTTGAFLEVRNFQLAAGRFFDEEEARASMRVAVVGQTVVKNLFGERPPVGETLRINRVPFLVVGVLAPKGLDANGGDQDDQVLIPIRTALRRVFNLDHVNEVYLQVQPGGAERAISQARELLRERHRLRAGSADDFSLQNQADVVAAERDAAQSFTLLLGAVSAVALLIGGVGVLAVMLIAVRERVREIGLRRAIGASRREIALQFTGEALAIGLA
ncbi:MAG: ABC transporter permease, partial [Myxococcaceae bacterium]